MEAIMCRAGNTIPFLTASTSRASPSKSSIGSQCCTLLGGSHSPHLLHVKSLSQVNAKRNEKRIRFILFAKADAEKEAVEDSATLESATQALPNISQPGSEFQPASLPIWIVVGFGAALLFTTAFLPSVSLGPLKFLREGLYVVGPSKTLQSIFYVGAFIHVLEAAFAAYLARRVDPQNQAQWFWQTLFLGFFSLRVLLQKSKQDGDLKQNL